MSLREAGLEYDWGYLCENTWSLQGLETEYQEEGQPLGRFTYDQEGDSLQMFHTLERPDQGFQIVELRVLSNWGHPEYTCLYRFRVHGEPIQ